MRRVTSPLLGALAVASMLWTCGTADAQTAGKTWKVGILEPFSASVRAKLLAAFRESLRESGYEEGRNLVIEPRFADGNLERLPQLAAELVTLKVDVIVAATTQGIQAAQRATRTIPIVMTVVGDPVGPGFVASFAKPGGNITGMTIQAPELIAKRMQLLKEVMPQASRVGIIWDPAIVHEVHGFKEAEAAAQQLGVTLLSVQVKRVDELEPVFAGMVRDGAHAVLVFENAFTSNNGKRIIELALRHRLPSVYGLRELAEAGGFLAYGPSRLDNYRRAAIFVDKILKGAIPADLPVEQPTKFELTLNMKTAKALGLTIPPAVLLRADQVVE